MDDRRDEPKRIYVLLRFLGSCRREGLPAGCGVELRLRAWATGGCVDIEPPERPTPGNAEVRRRVSAATMAAAREAGLNLPLALVAVLVAWHSVDPER